MAASERIKFSTQFIGGKYKVVISEAFGCFHFCQMLTEANKKQANF